MTRRLSTVLVALLCLGAPGLSAQPTQDLSWEGEWVAEGTLFRIAVTVEDGMMTVNQIESMGFVWSSEPGEVEGNVARVPIQYAGVTGVVQAELMDATTAIAFAASCVPEFMVVCALAKDRQAVFKRVSPD